MLDLVWSWPVGAGIEEDFTTKPMFAGHSTTNLPLCDTTL
jgi:hypothetical protein